MNNSRSKWDTWGNDIRNLTKKGKRWTLGKSTDQTWEAPEGLYWICGKYAYSDLPKKLYGTCTLGTIRPSFFLLPLNRGGRLGVPV
ncbi:ENR1 protein, partial [Eolophus roseicapillus]|nr:ENR1 protein [Eolophus roseicapilla]